MTDRKAVRANGFWRSPWGIALCALLALGALAFTIDHRLHVLQWLPFALLLACPLMHFFMHRGQGGHGSHGDRHGGGCCESAQRDRDKP